MSKPPATSLILNSQTRYVAYYRVSTRAQGDSGLGLEAQQSAIANFVKGPIIAEFTEVESGKNNQREKLAAAIERSKKENAVLVIAKLDRLSRNASFIFTLRDSGVNFQCVDMPLKSPDKALEFFWSLPLLLSYDEEETDSNTTNG